MMMIYGAEAVLFYFRFFLALYLEKMAQCLQREDSRNSRQ